MGVILDVDAHPTLDGINVDFSNSPNFSVSSRLTIIFHIFGRHIFHNSTSNYIVNLLVGFFLSFHSLSHVDSFSFINHSPLTVSAYTYTYRSQFCVYSLVRTLMSLFLPSFISSFSCLFLIACISIYPPSYIHYYYSSRVSTLRMFTSTTR